MDHDDWAICACIKFKDGELLDKSKPFATYHIEAPTAKKAVEKLEKAFDCCDVIVYGEPVHSIVTEEEYENGK